MIAKVKKNIRKEIKEIRNLMTYAMVKNSSDKIFQHLIENEIFRNSMTVFTYVSFKNEVKTDDLIRYCLKNHKKVIVPLCNNNAKTIKLSELKQFPEELEKGTMGILEPKAEYFRPVDLKEVDLALVPAIAYDYRGYRVGYGGGYYDRLMENKSPNLYTIGLCYQFQIIPNIPRGVHDFAVDCIITEEGMIKTAIG
ncbi:MAG: 5-formyltetrahydrofolate cyclo-ligase [Clostridia bacterium]|nr:5-formyltetrahydrofolate cyclo-ligase [Clostridia bacterium]